ncbi:hypothetical protein [Streptomyces sp. NPDC001985]|uniref:hypothetical protein n=1 Tax=Streptomyces sp. NPDC001985 TaxID=3154406 RepID=UPI00331C615A
MPLTAGQLRELVRQVTDTDPKQRELGADRVSDWLGSYSPSDINTLCGILSMSAAVEDNSATAEAQLNALTELGSTGSVHAEYISRLREINLDRLHPNLVEYVNDLLETP